MARPVTIKPGKFFVRLSDGETPPVFAAPCGFNQKSFSRSKTLGSTIVNDCDGPDVAAWEERDVQSMSATISGSGVLAKEALPVWEKAMASTDSVECEVEFEFPDSTSNIYTGLFHLESLEITASQGERVQISVTMQSDGEIVLEASGP